MDERVDWPQRRKDEGCMLKTTMHILGGKMGGSSASLWVTLGPEPLDSQQHPEQLCAPTADKASGYLLSEAYTCSRFMRILLYCRQQVNSWLLVILVTDQKGFLSAVASARCSLFCCKPAAQSDSNRQYRSRAR